MDSRASDFAGQSQDALPFAPTARFRMSTRRCAIRSSRSAWPPRSRPHSKVATGHLPRAGAQRDRHGEGSCDARRVLQWAFPVRHRRRMAARGIGTPRRGFSSSMDPDRGVYRRDARVVVEGRSLVRRQVRQVHAGEMQPQTDPAAGPAGAHRQPRQERAQARREVGRRMVPDWRAARLSEEQAR